jgi:hypothetical protein
MVQPFYAFFEQVKTNKKKDGPYDEREECFVFLMAVRVLSVFRLAGDVYPDLPDDIRGAIR